jgi:integrase
MRWRAHYTTYIEPRITDPEWRARAGVPDGRATLTIPEARRYALPVAAEDWRAFALGVGPDPREIPTPAVARVLRAADLLTEWFEATEIRKRLKSWRDVSNRVGQLSRWLDARPAADLLCVETYGELRRAWGATTTQADGLIASVLRPAVLWALDCEVLSGRSPFGRRKIRVAKSRKRTRVISHEEEAAIRQALQADSQPDALRLLDYLSALTATACRPVELALLQVRDIDYRRHLLVIPPEKSKIKPEQLADAEARLIPYDPSGALAKLLNDVRLRGASHYIFASEQPEADPTHPADWTRLGRHILDGFRAAWRRAVVQAFGGARTPAETRRVYRQADVVIRDFRRTTSTRWNSCGLPQSRISYLLGHDQSSMTARYIRQDIAALARDLNKHVWTNQITTATEGLR